MNFKQDGTFNSHVVSLEPKWKPNDIIKMFHEERSRIEGRDKDCENLLIKTGSILKEAVAIKDLYAYISPKTSQLHSECKNLVQERNELRDSFEKINNTLGRQEELRGIFKRIPEIKNQVFATLNIVSQKFQTQVRQDKTKSSLEDITPLEEYYGKFFIECRRIKQLTTQLESCLTCASNEESTIFLEEIYRLYIDIREQLMLPIYTRYLQRLISKSDRNYCDLLQQSYTSLVRMMRNEIQLFQQIFPSSSQSKASKETTSIDHDVISDPSNKEPKEPDESTINVSSDHLNVAGQLKKQALREMLELFCMTFYENLRPVIIHINHLETLAELYKLINESLKLESNDECFLSTINQLAQDIQERMAFRTEVFIQESILDYKPSQGDLAYPEKFDLIPNGGLNDYQSMWYPTVQRTVLTLLYLNRVFDPITFRDLARDLVVACYQSLDMAQRLVDERHGGSKVEASVFVSKHSAIIINQLQSYGIDQSELPPPPPLLACTPADSQATP